MTKRSSKPDDLVVRFASDTVNESDGYAVIDTNARPDITEVRLYEETIDHVKEAHAGQFPSDLPSIVGAVGDALRNPTETQDSYNNSVEYVDSNTLNANGHPLRVFVRRVDDTTSARLKTFFFAGTEDDDD